MASLTWPFFGFPSLAIVCFPFKPDLYRLLVGPSSPQMPDQNVDDFLLAYMNREPGGRSTTGTQRAPRSCPL